MRNRSWYYDVVQLDYDGWQNNIVSVRYQLDFIWQ